MRNYLLLISFLISAGMVNAQDSVNSGGGTALSSAGFASFSIGQPFFVSQISATGAVYPGIQQGYEISSEAESRIDMASLSAGVYFLKVLKDNRLLKTFKILKK